jgi:hypothetical protein
MVGNVEVDILMVGNVEVDKRTLHPPDNFSIPTTAASASDEFRTRTRNSSLTISTLLRPRPEPGRQPTKKSDKSLIIMI